MTVTYNLAGPYTISEAHVDLYCGPIDKCAPSQYTFSDSGLADVFTYATSPITFPTCTGDRKAYLIVHAAVGTVVTGITCPATVA